MPSIEKLLAGLDKDERPAVKRAVQRARDDLRDPAGRARREKEQKGQQGEHGDHDGRDGRDGHTDPRP